jgi:hypothetical protein
LPLTGAVHVDDADKKYATPTKKTLTAALKKKVFQSSSGVARWFVFSNPKVPILGKFYRALE